MARIYPSDWKSLEPGGIAARALQTLELLERGLPDSVRVVHGLHWTRVHSGFSVLDGIDFLIIGPDGSLVLIEQRSGLLEDTPEGLFKGLGPARIRHDGLHVDHRIGALRARLQRDLATSPPPIDYLLYCPDHSLRQPGQSPGRDPRVVDHANRDALVARVGDLVAGRPPQVQMANRLLAYFCAQLDLVPDTAAMIGQAQALVTRLSDGLATWARRLDFTPFRLHITATAGAGKTQLALAALDQAAREGRRALYLCFNRPLADHMAGIVDSSVRVGTFHQFCESQLRLAGQPPDFTHPEVFEDMARRLTTLTPVPEQFDELVIDEGQDFDADWVETLQRWIAPPGRAWFLEDPMQRLYERRAPLLTGWVRLTDHSNYRSPRRLLADINRITCPSHPVRAAGPIEGEAATVLAYDTPEQLLAQTRHAVTQALMAGFRKQDIVLLTFRGRTRSSLMNIDRLGNHVLKRIEPGYDLLGNPRVRPGDLLVETLYRFKGQSAPCVILTEVDFAELDEAVRRKLFVGMTRASLRLYVIASTGAAHRLGAAVEAGAAQAA